MIFKNSGSSLLLVPTFREIVSGDGAEKLRVLFWFVVKSWDKCSKSCGMAMGWVKKF
jgi:hypothetical protein